MELIVTFKCYTCMGYNKHHSDDKDYETKAEETESLTEAFTDHVANGHHVMLAFKFAQ